MSSEEKNQPAEISLEQVLPEDFVKSFKEKKYTSLEEAQKSLQEVYKSVLGRSGFGDVKATQTGTHKAVQSKLIAAAKELEIDLDTNDQSQTADVIDQLKTKVAELKKSGKAQGGLTEEEKQQIKDLEQLKKALSETNKALEEERKLHKESLTKAQQEKLELVKVSAIESELDKAIKNTSDKRISTLKDAAIRALFNSTYKIEAKLDDANKVVGFELRTLDGKLAQKNANDLLTIEGAMLKLYSDSGLLTEQKQQKTPISAGGYNPNSDGQKPTNKLAPTNPIQPF